MKLHISILFVLIFLYSCGNKEVAVKEPGKYVLSDTMQRMIQTDSVRYCNLSDEVTLSGQVSFDENNVIKIFPRSSGQVTECRVSLGDHVSKGQVLAVIRSADVAGNYSDLSSANADLSIAKRQMDNARSLFESGIGSEREYTEARENYEKAVAARSKVQAQISINGGGGASANGQYVLTAPIDGYLVEKKVNAGSFIRPDAGDNLFTISDLKNVWVYANVYEADIRKVKEGYPVRVRVLSYPDKTFEGRIDRLSEVLDPESKALRARIVLPNADLLLKPEMFAKVVVSSEQGTKAVCVPTAALLAQDGKDYVVICNSRADLRIAEVNILKTVNDRTFVTSGVKPGQMVITRNQLLVFNQLLNE